jgi:hypothetical protein
MPASCTAQILVGGSTNYWGGAGVGIGPDRNMYLVEGSRAAWVLEPVTHNSQANEIFTWIPSGPERLFADGLVMIAVLVDQDPDMKEIIESRLKPEQAQALLTSSNVDLTDMPDDVLGELQAAAPNSIRSKLVITVMAGSSISGQVALLDRGSIEAELCTVSWARAIDPDGKPVVAGKLPPDDPDAHRFYEVRI